MGKDQKGQNLGARFLQNYSMFWSQNLIVLHKEEEAGLSLFNIVKKQCHFDNHVKFEAILIS